MKIADQKTVNLKTSKLSVALSTFLVSASLASCAPPEESNPGEQMNRPEAEEKVEEHITTAANSLSEDVTLNPVGRLIFQPCEIDSPDSSTAMASRSYWIDGIPQEKNEETVEELNMHWERSGWKVGKDERPQNLRIRVERENDGFTMSVKESADGNLSLGASSPCVPSDNEE